MTDVDKLKVAWEKADEKAGRLTGEYEEKRQKALDTLKERYKERLDKATKDAAEAQREYMAYAAAAALLERGEEGEKTLVNHRGPAGERLRKAYEDLKGS